jgi:PAS domain S-box-containing protein
MPDQDKSTAELAALRRHQQQLEQQLQYRLKFEALLASLSTRFVGLAPADIDEAIMQALREVGEFIGAERGVLVLFAKGGGRLDNTHEWCAPGVSPQLHNRQQVALHRLPLVVEQIKRLKLVHFPDIDALPFCAEKEYFQAQSSRSLLALPLAYWGMPIGFLGFETVSQTKAWPPEDLTLLGILAEILINGLERKSSEAGQQDLLLAEHQQRLLAETLSEVTLALAAEISHGATLEEILRQVQRLVPYRTAHIMLLDGDMLSMACYHGYQEFGSAEFMANLVQSLPDLPLDVDVIRSRRALIIPDTHDEPRWVASPETAWVRSSVMAPICLQDRVLGLLRLDSDQPGGFSMQDAERLQPLVSAAAVALENARLYEQAQLEIAERKWVEEEIRHRNYELALLNRLIAASTTDLEPEAILEMVCHELARTLDLPQAFALLLKERRTSEMTLIEWAAQALIPTRRQTYPILKGFSLQCLLEYQAPPVVRANEHSLPCLDTIRNLLTPTSHDSLLILPLTINKEVVGAVGLGVLEPRQFSDEEISLAQNVTGQAASAVSRARMAQTHKLLITAIEQSAESVIITDTKGDILYVNPTFEQITGYSRAEAIGRNPRFLKSGKQEPTFYHALWAQISAGQVWHGRFINKTKDGSFCTQECTISPVWGQEGAAISNYVAVQRDVTHELELEEQYRHAQKMEAVGRLAGGVAHDFNNLLTVITGHCDLILESLVRGDPLRRDVKAIKGASEQATRLTRQLLAFSRKQVIQPKIINLNEIVGNMNQMLRPLIGEDIELMTRYTSTLEPIKADPSQLEQLIMNLVVNACDAMPHGGQLTLETANLEFEQSQVNRNVTIPPGAYVMLSVQDTGLGMDEETLSRIFEPFFTTKEPGKGTGLGLSTVYGIVEQSHGYIQVESSPKQGTTFRIYFPQLKAKEAAPSSRTGKSLLTKSSLQGAETILLVEDEEGIRLVIRRTLQKRGYHVLEARHGRDAQEICQTYQGPIHLLVTDVVLPGRINGRELAEYLKPLYPELKVLYMSGYTNDAVVQRGVLDLEVAFLQKPFTLDLLAYKIRELLDTPTSYAATRL